MKCSNHPKRDADFFCSSCGIPICQDCVEESESGKTYCFQCAMLHSVSEVGSSIESKRHKAAEKKLKKKKPWGPFQYERLLSQYTSWICIYVALRNRLLRP